MDENARPKGLVLGPKCLDPIDLELGLGLIKKK